MKRITATLLVLGLAATPSLAGLKLTATPDKASYNSIAGESGSMARSVDLITPPPTSSIQFVTGPALSATPISLSFVPQAGATGTAPVITGTSTNSAEGWNPVIALTPTTFTAFNFNRQDLGGANPLSELIGQASFDVSDPNTNGFFDLMVSAFSLDGDDMPGQVIGTIKVVGIPEPSSFVFLGLVGSGIAGVQVWRRRRKSDVDEPTEAEEVA